MTLSIVASAQAASSPRVGGVRPNVGPTTGGTEVKITGRNFTAATAVHFGSAGASFTTLGATEITAHAPPGAGTVNVTVTTPLGVSPITSADQFTYVSRMPTCHTRASIEHVEERIVQIRRRIQLLLHIVAQFRARILFVSATIITVKSNLGPVLAALATVNGEIKETQEEIDGLLKTIADDHSKIRALTHEVVTMEKELKFAKIHINMLHGQFNRLKLQREGYEAYLGRLQARLAQVEAAPEPPGPFPGLIAQLTAEIGTTEGNITATSDAMDAVTNQIQTIEGEIPDKEMALTLTRNALKNARSLLQTHEGLLANARSKLKGLVAKRTGLLHTEITIEIQLTQLTLLLIELEAKLTITLELIETLEVRIVTLEEEIVSIETECEPVPTTLTTSLSGGTMLGGIVTVPSGTAVGDDAKLHGPRAGRATGSVTYSVYSDNSCTKLVADAGTVTVSGRAVPPSNPEKLAPGTYFWRASYGGDKANSPSANACGTEVETVTP